MPDKKRSIRVDWEDLRVLIELAREGSLSATARSLGVTHVTVSRRIANLESDLGQPLFKRDTGRYVLTEAGKRILDLASPMAASADAVVRASSGLNVELSGPVRITATEAVAVYIVMPTLKAIQTRYPDIDLELNVTQQNLNLARNDVEIAVRLAKPEANSGLVGVTVAELDYFIFGARSYVDGRNPEQLEFIGYQDEFATWPEAVALVKAARGRRISIRINHLSNRIEATRCGLGVSLLPALMAERWPELVRVEQATQALTRGVHVLVHEDLKDVPRIKACVEVMVETLRHQHGRRD